MIKTKSVEARAGFFMECRENNFKILERLLFFFTECDSMYQLRYNIKGIKKFLKEVV